MFKYSFFIVISFNLLILITVIIQKGCIKLIKSDSKDIYIVT